LQNNGQISYKFSPAENLGVGKRLDFFAFAEFCTFHGNILDVGVGPQKLPTHIQYCKKKEVFFVGIDPLKGVQKRSFPFVHGLAEFLPFNNNLFDQVLFVTSLDHFLDPNLAFTEAKRVLKDRGELCIWFGEKDKNAPMIKKTHEWYENLTIPEGAIDKFHLIGLTKSIFLDYVYAHHLKIVDFHVQNVDHWRKNSFYKLAKDVR
jgi:SAM-dependent methyltransferase